MPDLSYIALIPALPLISFLIIGLSGDKMPVKLSGILGTGSIFASAIISFYAAWHYFYGYGLVDGSYQTFEAFKMLWLQFSPALSVDMGIIVDPISVMMMVVVTTVSAMVHLYSNGYMHGEKGFSRFFSILSLFTFSMLGLVMATNILEMYIFWELVGVSSFLLIGYYYDKPSAVAASKKAFIITRFADLGFLIGILALSFHAETLDIRLAIERLTTPGSQYLLSITSISFMGASLLTWVMLLIFMGGAGKSAMFPLHIWLPHAMEGPTPVSALIHAATMVVAGVYLVARLFPIFAISVPNALLVVAWIGAFSSLFAAVIACTQKDIKRVLAYSTMSQIGYMMLALGVSGYGGHEGLGFMASMFHLFTHAFFKALLFLCAGVVIHIVHSNSIDDMGGLRKYMPITNIAFLIACLAIAGIPPFAGFFSKEEILVAAFHTDKFIYFMGLFTAGLTAFYMFRLYYGIFWKRPEPAHAIAHHGKEAPLSMTLPLIFLAIGSIVAGFVKFPELVTSDGHAIHTEFHLSFALPAILVALIGIGIATWMYGKETNIPARIQQSIQGFYTAVYDKFYFDELYLFITQKIIFAFVSRPLTWIENTIVDYSINHSAVVVAKVSNRIKGFQSGKTQQYALYFLAGVLIFSLVFIYYLKG